MHPLNSLRHRQARRLFNNFDGDLLVERKIERVARLKGLEAAPCEILHVTANLDLCVLAELGVAEHSRSAIVPNAQRDSRALLRRHAADTHFVTPVTPAGRHAVVELSSKSHRTLILALERPLRAEHKELSLGELRDDRRAQLAENSFGEPLRVRRLAWLHDSRKPNTGTGHRLRQDAPVDAGERRKREGACEEAVVRIDDKVRCTPLKRDVHVVLDKFPPYRRP